MGRFTRVGAVLVALLMVAGVLAGCGDQQAEADKAMTRANEAMEEWTAADDEFSLLVEQIADGDTSTAEGIQSALSLVDEMSIALDASTDALKKANSELASILEMNVDEEYKTYVEMLIESNDTDLASDEKGREVVEAMRQMFAEAGNEAPDAVLVNESGEKANAAAAEMDELAVTAQEQAEAAQAYFEEQGFSDSQE